MLLLQTPLLLHVLAQNTTVLSSIGAASKHASIVFGFTLPKDRGKAEAHSVVHSLPSAEGFEKTTYQRFLRISPCRCMASKSITPHRRDLDPHNSSRSASCIATATCLIQTNFLEVRCTQISHGGRKEAMDAHRVRRMDRFSYFEACCLPIDCQGHQWTRQLRWTWTEGTVCNGLSCSL